ncbi:MAG TPA: hypothetical protein VFF32_06500 [Dermatophilaceae bacterium]|nr:hypothetical protein [Dermatophilaceae bacterium]
MTKISTKVILTGAATMLGVSMVAGGAYAASGSMTAADAPGRVVQVSGVGPAAAHANTNAMEHANTNAKGLSGATAAHSAAPATTHVAAHVTMHATVHQVARPAAQHEPARHAVTSTSGTEHGGTDMHGSTGTTGSTGMMR